MENDCVTVIIPVYNTDEKFMNKCIESVANQTYKNIEIIIVDDGSNKETYRILEGYKGKYKNITLYHKKNGGVSSARNYALDRAKGRWVAFVDSDDYLYEDGIEKLVENSKDCQIVMGETLRSNRKEYKPKIQEKAIYKENKDDIIISALLSAGSPISNAIGLWGKLYDLSFLNWNKIRFARELTYSEDLIFNIECYLKAEVIVCIPNYIYMYNKNNQESATSGFIFNFHKMQFKAIKVLSKKFNKSIVNAYRQNYYDFLLAMMTSYVTQEIFHQNNKSNIIEKIRLFKEIANDEYYAECIKNVDKKKIGKGRRLLVNICRTRLYSLVIIYVLLRKFTSYIMSRNLTIQDT